MYKLDFLNPNKKIHFLGIGGISMSALAEILKKSGFIISGSDMNLSKLTSKLENMGIEVIQGHDETNIRDADIIVYTAAVKEDNPEFIAAKNKNLPMLDRAELLGQIMDNYKHSIAISGTHGKTTTTSMLSHILLEAKTNPTIHVGGELDIIGGNVLVGENNYFVTEACEYANSFLKFHPFLGIILNIEEDHLDYFKDLDEIISSFIGFTKNIHPDGFLIINKDQTPVEKIKDHVPCTLITYGKDDSDVDWTVKDIQYNDLGYPTFEVFHKQEHIGTISLNVPGEHNIFNALSSIAAAHCLNIPFDFIQKGLFHFRGTHRRFEYKGTINEMLIIDDYAHHPTEIKATLSAAKNYPHKKIWAIFQPHTYSRTKSLLNDFANAFMDADEVIITDIYAAREKNLNEIHSKDLVEKIKKYNKKVCYIENFEEIVEYLLKNGSKEDLLITMGAGDIYKVGEMILSTGLSTLSTVFSTISTV